MNSEQREEPRFKLPRQPTGKLQILVGNRSIDVLSVVDVSANGLALELGSVVDVGLHILVSYVSELVNIQVNGTAVWVSDIRGESDHGTENRTYHVGVRLASPSLLQAFW